MVQYLATQKFLRAHPEYYCESCLAQQLHFSIEDIRRSLREWEHAEITVTYKLCRDCLSGKTLASLRH